tara:strand:- start:1672 stop:2496 length:825 start_codon:yes stop_codon:yes gene_type:complete
VNKLRTIAFALALLMMLTPIASAEDTDGDGFENPREGFTVWDGADAYPNNPDVHEPVFSTGCDPPVAKLDLAEPVTFTCTIRNEGPIAVSVYVEVDEGVHLTNRFIGETYTIDSEQRIELKINLVGLSQGITMAKLQVYARANGSPSEVFELPIEVTGEEWKGLNSQGQSQSTPSFSLFSTIMDETADWLSEHTPWEFSSLNAGLLVLIMGLALIGIVRRKRARIIWLQNMQEKNIGDNRMEARFDAIRKERMFQYGEEPTIPESPTFIIRRNR